jgi:GT2 family glycosyltransferase
MLRERPILSIIIPSCSQPLRLQRCLESVQQYAPDRTEIIVIDDGSKDQQISQAVDSFAGVISFRNAESQGFACSVNRGIRAARAPIVELLNDDTEVTPGWAEEALKCFEDSGVASVAPLVLLSASKHSLHAIIDSAGDGYDPGGFAFKRGHRQRLTNEFLHPQEVFGASASTAFYHRESLMDIGLFPEHFGSYFEDVDVACRLRAAGYRSIYQPTSIVWHDGGSSHPPSNKLLKQQSRNEERLFWRNSSIRNLPRHGMVLAGKAIRRSREGTIKPFLLGRMQAWMELFRPISR